MIGLSCFPAQQFWPSSQRHTRPGRQPDANEDGKIRAIGEGWPLGRTGVKELPRCRIGETSGGRNGATATLATGSEISLVGTGPPDRRRVGLMSRAPFDAKAPMDKPYFKLRANPGLAQSDARRGLWYLRKCLSISGRWPTLLKLLQSVAHQLHREHTCCICICIFQVAA